MKKKSVFCVFFLVVVSLVYSLDTPTTKPSIKFSNVLPFEELAKRFIETKNSSLSVEQLRDIIENTYNYLIGVYDGYRYGSYEVALNKELSIFNNEAIRNGWDKYGNIALLVGTVGSIVVPLFYDQTSGITDTQLALQISPMALGSLLKIVFSEISKSKAIEDISLARQAYDDILIRVNIAKEFKSQLKKIINELSPYYTLCITKKETKAFAADLDLNKLSSLAIQINDLGNTYNNLGAEYITRVKYYADFFDKKKVQKEKNVFMKIYDDIIADDTDFRSSGRIGYYSALFKFNLSQIDISKL